MTLTIADHIANARQCEWYADQRRGADGMAKHWAKLAEDKEREMRKVHGRLHSRVL
jgi:hypothetical protein